MRNARLSPVRVSQTPRRTIAVPMPGATSQIVELTICENCKGKITRSMPSWGGSLSATSWTHMASVGPNGEAQHGERTCPPEGSRP